MELAAESALDPNSVQQSEGDSAGERVPQAAVGSLLYESSPNSSTCDESSMHSQRQQPVGDSGASELRAAAANKSLEDSSALSDTPANGSKSVNSVSKPNSNSKLLSSTGSKQDRLAIPVHHPVQCRL